MTTPNIAAAGDALMASLAPSLPTPMETELPDKLSAARRRCEALELENERLRSFQHEAGLKMAECSARVAELEYDLENLDKIHNSLTALESEAFRRVVAERDALELENERLRSDLALLSERAARLMEATR